MSSLSHRFFEYIQSANYLDRRPIVFIDSRVNNCDDLVQQASLQVRVIVLGSMTDGVKAITQTLNSSFCREVHLVCLGTPGCLYLGRSELSRNTLIQYERKLQTWFGNIDVDADSPQLHIYGCNAAAGDVGAEFLARLNSMTRAEITASTNVYNSSIFC